MHKLNFNGYNYTFTTKRNFESMGVIPREQLIDCINFANEMTFNKNGEHRAYRTGGQVRRRIGQIFANTLQGKIAEYAIYNKLKSIYPNISEPDLNAHELGVWDDSDFIIENKKLAIKSTKYYGQLLLLETKDWDYNGNYIPNQNNENHGYYDYFILVRIKTEIEQIMKSNRLLYIDNINQEQFNILVNAILNSDWNYDIPGFITHNDLVKVISENFIIPQNALLGSKTRMDAENYYIQAGDLKNIDLLEIN